MTVRTGTPNLEEAKIITWFEVGLRHEAIRLSRKRQRILKHELLILNQQVKTNEEENSIEMIDTIQEGYEGFYFLTGSHNPFREVENNIYLQQILSVLTMQQHRIIKSTVLEGRTEIETSKSLGISQPAVHKMKNRALKRLRRQYTVDEHINKL